MNEKELLQALLTEVREIRKNLDTIKIVLRDMQTRLANMETSRLIPESVRHT